MPLATIVIAALAGAAGAIALGLLVAPPVRAVAWRALLGGSAGGVGGPLIIMASMAGRAPRPPVAATAGIDVGGMLGVAATGALCGVIAVLAVALVQRRARR